MSAEDFNMKKAALEEQIQDAEVEAGITLDNSEVIKLREDLERLEQSRSRYENAAETAGDISETQLKQVENMGGTPEAAKEKTHDVDEKIEGVKAETEEKIEKASEAVPEEVKTKENAPKQDVLTEKFNALNEEIAGLSGKTLAGEEKARYESLLEDRKQVVSEFLAAHGYEDAKQLPHIEGANNEANQRTAVLNNFLGLELPVAGKDLSIYEMEGKKYLYMANKGDYMPDSEDSKKSRKDRALLVSKQVELFGRVSSASENVKKLTPDQKAQVPKEITLEAIALRGEDSENPVRALYMPMAQEYKKSFYVVEPDENQYPKSIAGFNKNFAPSEMRSYMYQNAKAAIGQLLMEKKAKEHGWLE